MGISAGMLLSGQATLPPVFLNHVQIVLPSPVYAALQESPFVKNELCSFAEKTNTTRQAAGNTWSYTGIYLRGRKTYLEFFEDGKVYLISDPTRSKKTGAIMLGMSIDDRNRMPAVRDRLVAETGSALNIRTTTSSTTNLPTWDTVTRKASPGPAETAIVFTLFGFYPDGITRATQLENRYLPDRLLNEITGLTLSVTPAESEELIKSFRASGYRIEKQGKNQIASGPEITFTLTPRKPEMQRKLVLNLALNRDKTGDLRYRFSDTSELVFSGATAQWTFLFPSD